MRVRQEGVPLQEALAWSGGLAAVQLLLQLTTQVGGDGGGAVAGPARGAANGANRPTHPRRPRPRPHARVQIVAVAAETAMGLPILQT